MTAYDHAHFAVESSLPEGLTLPEYRRQRPVRRCILARIRNWRNR